ncbi:hypothetical protein GUITHDRAFT_90739 [Guillardia theta CCMP2712]|uniref:Uncharacterized protein n=1 Tax=Guillardia theta (strain CCMP2712) TaxID=905079 RepID=L1IBJ0_GUITC|nr:hypothetical protein GUITHDRAFT_90739 [Guillardia theta CCMP2712]EKX33447.1 hypothetical protein GUITHDRAFT_90739 [Guillardia theta CCMP2712]|eukprot:XP_005820427.1 hypothetical protein GUITHDRAFT_90739 [Guillardia theta CCMP2712]
MSRISFRSKELENQISRRKAFLGPSLSTHYHNPILVERGRGTFLIDFRDQAFLDFVNNPASLGHCHPHVVRAAAEQLAQLNTNTRYVYAELTDYAEQLTRLFPEKLHVCFFVNSGSEANDLALRIARAHTKAQDFIVMEGAYHGHTEELIKISPYKFDGKGGFPQPANVWKVPVPDMFRGDHRSDSNPARSYALHVKTALDKMKTSGKRPAAFICEGMLSTAGYHPLPPRYLKQVYELVREEGGVCISDEVQSGFGRAGEGKMWGFELGDAVPDIVTLGKPMGNGFPLAAVVTTKELAASFANGMEYFNTFGGSTAAMRVGQAVLEIRRKRDREEERRRAVGRHLKKELNKLRDRHECIGDVRGSGLFLGLEFVRDKSSCLPAPGLTTYVVEASRCRGLLLGSDGIHNNVLKIKPPLCLSRFPCLLLLLLLLPLPLLLLLLLRLRLRLPLLPLLHSVFLNNPLDVHLHHFVSSPRHPTPHFPPLRKRASGLDGHRLGRSAL